MAPSGPHTAPAQARPLPWRRARKAWVGGEGGGIVVGLAAGLLSAIPEGAQDFRAWSQKAPEFWNPQVLRCGINSRNCPRRVVPALIFGDGREGGGLKRVVVSLRTPPRPPPRAWGEEETHLHHQPLQSASQL